MLPGKNGAPVSDVLQKQYDLIHGSWPNSYGEIVLVLDENNELDDMTLYAMGLLSEEEIDKIMSAAVDGTTLESTERKWTYEEICALEYKVILNSSCYAYEEATGLYRDLRETDAGLRYLYDNGLTLKVTGIIRPNEEATAAMLSGSIGYTSALTKYVITESQKSPAIQAQRDNPTVDVINGLPFSENTGNLSVAEKASDFRDYLADMKETEKAATYVRIKCIPAPEFLEQSVAQALAGMTREDMEKAAENILRLILRID
jgi:putative ABC transport system permease protein